MRTILSRTDGPTEGYETLVVQAQIEANAQIARHTHPGIESGYILEGGLELHIENQQPRPLKPGDAFQVPAGVPHAGNRNGDRKTVILSTYVVEKSKPLASPA